MGRGCAVMVGLRMVCGGSGVCGYSLGSFGGSLSRLELVSLWLVVVEQVLKMLTGG